MAKKTSSTGRIKLIDTIQDIGGHNIKVKFPYQFTERDDVAGLCDHYQDTIMISAIDPAGRVLPKIQVLTLLIHELIHRIDDISGFKVFDDNEPAINGHAELWRQILTNNRGPFLRMF